MGNEAYNYQWAQFEFIYFRKRFKQFSV